MKFSLKYVSVLGILCGTGMVFHQAQLTGSGLPSQLNPFEIKESPYGEVVAMALQDPVHLLWHGGQGHEHSHGDDHSHDHEGEHAHDHAEGEYCATCGVVHAQPTQEKVPPMSVRGWKLHLLELEGMTRRNHSPVARVGAVREFEKKRARDLMKLAYELDPTNYGNYNALSFFYATTNMAGEDHVQAVFDLAKYTMEVCDRQPNDPYDALTAASAAEVVLIYKTTQLGGLDYIYQVREEYEHFLSRVAHYKKLVERMKQDGSFEKLPEARVIELEQRAHLFEFNAREYEKRMTQSTVEEKKSLFFE